VFDRFRQADSSITRSYGGLGLGLAIVRHLVELHGGTVAASSLGLDRGATFTIQLPLLTLHNEVVNPEKDSVSLSALPLDRLRVLIVDDEADTRELLVAALQTYGAIVTAAASVQAAIAILPRSHSDVLVSDIGMPDEDGYSLIRQVRLLPADQGGNIPAIALTAYASAEDQAKALSAGFQAHLAKPVEPENLAAAIARLAESDAIAQSL
jgi:CheY-like chemotaxis protein